MEVHWEKWRGIDQALGAEAISRLRARVNVLDESVRPNIKNCLNSRRIIRKIAEYIV